MLTQDRDEELVLFLEIGRLEKESSDHCKSTRSTTSMSSQQYPLRRTAADNFLYSEDEKSDYDWLVTPPGSPSKSSMNQLDAPDATLMALKSQVLTWLLFCLYVHYSLTLVSLFLQLESCREEERNKTSSKNQTIGLKRPSSSNSSRSTTRPSTPDRMSATPARRSKTPTSRVTSTAARANLTSSSTSSSRSTSRPSTPTRRPSSSGTSRATLTSSSTSIVRPRSRPSTPPKRPSSSGTSRANLTTARATTGTATSIRSSIRPISANSTKPGSRSSTPTRRPPTPPGSSTVSRIKPTKPECKPVPVPALRSRPWEPYEMPGFSLEAPSNLRTTLPDRPQTASSRRTTAFGASSSRSASIERTVARRQSCSPSRNRAPINGPGRAKKSNDSGDLISPVAKGAQMVERVVNARKLAPPRVTEKGGSNAGKGADGVGFGRNLSKSSFDMALRHMDIKQGSMKGNFRQLATKVPAASLYSVGSSGNRRKRPVSSSGSSESSSANILCLDASDDNRSDMSY
ncbi:unnamed protein product [Eruca vesicaria subsp. sativa]|uniref:Uncharacterized protein n=1 Tax=Eruca vesicaria subsp. sativa TaxID=29727 RepID=A0ABC8JX65_ERUVS|nr:unnamed protein product [Eruca vesicaria subsp. sativa]